MSRYLLSVINSGIDYAEEETSRISSAIGGFNDKLRSDGLEPPSFATAGSRACQLPVEVRPFRP